MKLIDSGLQKFFTIKHKGKTYSVDYLNSDSQALALINRFNWEIYNEDGNNFGFFITKKPTKKQKEEIKLRNKIINFCKKNFNNYKPDYK